MLINAWMLAVVPVIACSAATGAGSSTAGAVAETTEVEAGSQDAGAAADGLMTPPAQVGAQSPPPRSEPTVGAPSRHDLPPPEPLTRASGMVQGSCGDAHPGFAHWVSANGRLVLVRRFLHDHDGDGRIQPQFGHHGEPLGDEPTLALFDLETGRSEVYDEIISSDPMGRLVVLRKERLLWLVDSRDGTRVDLTARGADPQGDLNRCLPARQATIDPFGRTVTWLRAGRPGIVSRNLADGQEVVTEVDPAGGLLWRAMPMGLAGWLTVIQVPSDSDGNGQVELPVQNTSCACRYCGRFALSMGFYGWRGDDFELVLQSPAGTRIPIEGDAIALGGDVYGLRRGSELRRRDGSPIATPAGCDQVLLVPGSETVLLTCGDESRLFWPAEGRTATLPALVETQGPSPVLDADGHPWLAVRARDGAAWHMGRIRLTDGRLETGPAVTSVPTVPDFGWSSASTADGALMLDVGSGQLRSVQVSGIERVRSLSLGLGQAGWAVLDPRGRRWLETRVEPYLVTATGCSLEASQGQTRLETGPWQLRCAR